MLMGKDLLVGVKQLWMNVLVLGLEGVCFCFVNL
jgi:hypothetical protein